MELIWSWYGVDAELVQTGESNKLSSGDTNIGY